MQTFSQYAATRLLREHPARAQTFGGIAIKTGSIQTYAGIDLITGMPVFIYTMPEKPNAIPEVYSEFIPTILELGFEHDLGFVVTGSAPGYTPIKPVLTQQRLEWLVRSSSRAIADAHSVGLIHGNLEPSHFLACGDHLLLEGWGLPWGTASPDYQAPETNISLATDVFAWARSITMFGKGKPRVMLDGEFGRLVGHCLNPRPSERPTAQELVLALEQVLPPRNPTIPDIAETALELSATEFLETDTNTSNPIKRTKPLEIPIKIQTKSEPSTRHNKPELPVFVVPLPVEEPILTAVEVAPVSSVEVTPVSSVEVASPEAKLDAIEAELSIKTIPEAPEHLEPLQPQAEPILEVLQLPISPEIQPQPEPAQLSEPEHLAADEPDVQLPSRASSRITDDSDADAPRPAIRIGFDEEDQSWRSVVTPQKARSPIGRWIIIAVLIGLVIVLAGIFLSQPKPISATPRPINVLGDPSSGSVVTFNLRGSEGIKGRLIIVSAPNSSKLAVGALLATVPGPVAFPVSGEYRVRIEIPNYDPSEITVRVPQETQVNLELPR